MKISNTYYSKINIICVGAGETLLNLKPIDEDQFNEFSHDFTQLMKSETPDQDETIGPFQVKTKSVALTPMSEQQIIVKSRFCNVRITKKMTQEIDDQDVRCPHHRAEESTSIYHGTDPHFTR